MQDPNCDERHLKKRNNCASLEMDRSWNFLHCEWSHFCRVPSLVAPKPMLSIDLPTSMRQITRGVQLIASQCQIQIRTLHTSFVPFQASETQQFWCKKHERIFDLCTLGVSGHHCHSLSGFQENHLQAGIGGNFDLQKCPIR